MAEVAASPTSAAPSAQPAPGAEAAAQPAAPNFDDSGVRDAAPPDTTVRLARPIKPIPRLPGVFPDDDPFPAPPSDNAANPATAAAAPPRGPDGRFVATSSATPPLGSDGEHTLEPATVPADDTAGPFEFAGERFPTRAAAEQNFKSLRGQFKPLQGLARSLGGVEQVVPKFTEAAASARGWKAEAERLSAELAAARNGGSSPTPQPADAAPAEAAPADVDWELYAEIKKLATEKGEPWKAEQWLISEVRRLDRDHFTKTLDERDAPRKQQEARAAVAAQTETLFGSLADYTNADGSPAFPELSDEVASHEIGRLWVAAGLPGEHALTPQGALTAIALYRMSKQHGSQAGVAAANPPAPAAPSAPTPTDTASAASLVGGRPTVASVGGNGSVSAEAARIQAALRSTNSPNRSVLGFDA